MAAALCFAAKRWTPNGIDYAQDAAHIISDILSSDISGNFIKNGNRWGGPSCWNPCYFCPAWLRIFIVFIDENQSLFSDPSGKITTLEDTIANVYGDMDMIDSVNAKGLYPDWCDTSGSTVVKADGSDRWYYFTASDVNNDNYVTMQSFNFFYDAIRVPWRLAVDFSWFGDQCPDTEAMLYEMAAGFPQVNSIVDGYSIDGTPWEYNDRDGFNSYAGGTNPSTAFNSMMACSRMVLSGPSEDYYQSIVNGWEDPASVSTAYYPNTLRLLSLLYLSGYFKNPYDISGSTPDNPIYIERYAWGPALDLSNGYVWVKLDSSPGWGGWQIHHNNEGQFNVKVEAESGSPSEFSGVNWCYQVQQCKLETLVKITYISGSKTIIIQCW